MIGVMVAIDEQNWFNLRKKTTTEQKTLENIQEIVNFLPYLIQTFDVDILSFLKDEYEISRRY